MEEHQTIGGLILNCENDMSALEQLYLLYKNKVFAYAYTILRDFSLAEDALHETFIRLHKSAHRFKGKSEPQTFILGITKNTARELYRKQKRFVIQSMDALDKSVNSNDFTQNILMRQLLEALPVKQRETIVLHIYAELTFVEISSLLHAPVSTIKSRYQKALENLRNYMGENNL